MAGKQAKIISNRELNQILDAVKKLRYPLRSEVMVLLSLKAGLRAKEISCITWAMVTDASGQLTNLMQLPDIATKGKSGRTIPINSLLKDSLIRLRNLGDTLPHEYIIKSERGHKMTADGIQRAFQTLYKGLRLDGCSSHSGRRTFITNVAKNIIQAGGSMRDVQQMAGHNSLNSTARYIEGDAEAKRKVIDMI